jgi:two-component system LytT family response regulator
MKTLTLEQAAISLPLILSKTHNNFKKDHLFIKTQEGVFSLKKCEILFLQSNSNYTTIFMSNGENILCCKTLKYFEEILRTSGFVRPHHSFIVNFSKIKLLRFSQGSELVLINDCAIPVSRSRQAFITSLFQN